MTILVSVCGVPININPPKSFTSSSYEGCVNVPPPTNLNCFAKIFG
ncbi:hypothetical protein QW060_20925 [Myroides ceti]|uniref:Uncharacterized protein n=1 Tax=Paenimyroides ceti TaxID=395087 RepID=A0ABT8D1X2_9FLAO|nr:hypothetical protein [Paenimyroides ceti]MDN3709465.1 hypothetical protein [Paenimyroides ceti]